MGDFMYPFIELGAFRLPVYSLCIMLGIAAGLLAALVRSRKLKLDKNDILHIFLLASIGLIVGGKILFLLTSVGDIWNVLHSEQPLNALGYVFGGFVYYGGLIGGILAVLWYLRRYKLPVWEYLDCAMVSVPLMHAFGRVGCFFAGCCHGIQIDPPWGVYFANPLVVRTDISYLPIQLYEASLNLLIFAALSIVYRKHSLKNGAITAMYFISYAVMRFTLEFFRGDTDRGELFGFSTSQWISVLFLAIGIFLLIRPGRVQTAKA